GRYNIDTEYCVNENVDPISVWISLRKFHKLYVILIRIVILLLFIGAFIAYYYFQLFLYNISQKIGQGQDQNLGLFPLETYTTAKFGAQIIISVSFILIDLVWRLFCTLLTSLEAHKYSTSFRKSDCFKSFLSRTIMFNIFNIVHNTNTRNNSNSFSLQIINLLLLNTLVAPFIDILSTS